MLISEVRQSQNKPAGDGRRRRGRRLGYRSTKGKIRHPLIARSRAAVGIVFHAVTRPHKPAIINLDTGDVTTVDE